MSLPLNAPVNLGTLGTFSPFQGLESLSQKAQNRYEEAQQEKSTGIKTHLGSGDSYRVDQLQGAILKQENSLKAFKLLAPHVEQLESVVDGLRERLQEFMMQVTMLGPTASQPSRIPDAQMLVRGIVQDVALRLNEEGTYGSLFGGAETNKKPIDPQLVTDLNRPYGPRLSKPDLDAYFPSPDQKPFQMIIDEQPIVFPLQARDLQEAFQIFHDFLALPPDSPQAQETIEELCQWMEGGPLAKLNQATMAIYRIKEVCNNGEELSQHQLENAKEFLDQIVGIDPVRGAVNAANAKMGLMGDVEAMVQNLMTQKEIRDALKP